uniref:Uncharacterized protein n=1 Tax=Rhizophora mucronata TaxID=61149 RepID=A0A2P2PW42_RHIMU
MIRKEMRSWRLECNFISKLKEKIHLKALCITQSSSVIIATYHRDAIQNFNSTSLLNKKV